MLVCGGRDYDNRNLLFSVLNEIHLRTPIDCLIHGGARGADNLAGQWAKTHRHVTVVVVPAQWGEHGRAAGPIRNGVMVNNYKPDMVIACKGGNGTADCVRQAMKAGIKVVRVETKEEINECIEEA